MDWREPPCPLKMDCGSITWASYEARILERLPSALRLQDAGRRAPWREGQEGSRHQRGRGRGRAGDLGSRVGSRRTALGSQSDHVPTDRARTDPTGRAVFDRQRVRDPHRRRLPRPALLQSTGQSNRRTQTAVAVGRDQGARDHRGDGLQRGPGAPAEPQPKAHAAARRERPDLSRRARPMRLLAPP